MAPKLYMSILSPPVRAVLMTEKYLELNFEHVPVDIGKGEQRGAEYLKLNPFHTVPTFVDDDGFKICDSHAIITYIVQKYGSSNKNLYPTDLAKRTIVDQRLYFEASSVFGLIRNITLAFFAGAKSIAPNYIKEANDIYNILNTLLQETKWVAGDEFTVADFSLLSSVSTLNGMISIDSKFENVKNWLEAAASESFYEPNQKGLDILAAMYGQPKQ